MQLYQAFLMALIILAPGGFWLGYIFLINDAKWKIEQAKAAAGRGSVSSEEIAELRGQIEALQAELLAHRDRSTEFDLGLEAHLHRLEERMQKGSSELSARLGQSEGQS